MKKLLALAFVLFSMLRVAAVTIDGGFGVKFGEPLPPALVAPSTEAFKSDAQTLYTLLRTNLTVPQLMEPYAGNGHFFASVESDKVVSVIFRGKMSGDDYRTLLRALTTKYGHPEMAGLAKHGWIDEAGNAIVLGATIGTMMDVTFSYISAGEIAASARRSKAEAVGL